MGIRSLNFHQIPEQSETLEGLANDVDSCFVLVAPDVLGQ